MYCTLIALFHELSCRSEQGEVLLELLEELLALVVLGVQRDRLAQLVEALLEVAQLERQQRLRQQRAGSVLTKTAAKNAHTERNNHRLQSPRPPSPRTARQTLRRAPR